MNKREQAERAAASPMMTPREVADLYRVDSRTVTRWARIGRIPFITTPGGHRRYPRAEVMAAYEASRGGAES